jgi:hypothetical protein
MEKGHQKKVLTPGYNARRNMFVTLFWPKKKRKMKRNNWFVFNTYAKRRSREFKLHLSNVMQYARRRGAKKVILFVDHAPCHKTGNVKKFIREHPMLKVKMLPKRAPNLNPVERKVNKPLKSAVCTNRSYSGIDDVVRNGRRFLRKYARSYGT